MLASSVFDVMSVAYQSVLRTVTRVRFWCAVAAVASLTCASALEAATIQGPDGRPLGLHVGIAFTLRAMSLLPLVLPLVAGDVLAADLGSGYLDLVRARNVSGAGVVGGYALGNLVVSTLAGICSAVAPILVATALLRAEDATDPVLAFPFEPGLLAGAPVGHVVLMVGLYVLAGAALLCLAMLVGALSRSTLLASLAVPLGVLALGVFMPGGLQALNPLERLMFANVWGAPWATTESVFAYWAVVGCAATLFGFVEWMRQEARA